MVIRLPLGENVPDAHEQPAGNGDDGLVGMFFLLEAIVLSFQSPKGRAEQRIAADSAPGSFDHGPAELLATLFGDRLFLIFLAADMHAGTQSGVADQLLGRGKARDVADSGEYDHGEDHAETGDLQEEDGIRRPGLGVAQFSQFLIDGCFSFFQMSEDLQVMLDLKLDQIGEGLLVPPACVLLGPELALGWGQVEALDVTLEAVLPKGIGTMLDMPICLLTRQRKETKDRKSRT